MSNFNQSHQSVHNQSNAGGDVIDNRVQNIVNNHIPSPLNTVKAAWSTALKWFRDMLPETRRNYSSIVQFDAEHNREMERIARERLELARVDSSQRAYAENRLIQLKEEEQELQRVRFEWEKSVAQENLRLIRDSHASALEVSRERLQVEKDKHLKLQVSRDDIIRVISKENGKFIIVPSPPEILRDDLAAFKSLKAEIPPKLGRIIEKYYGGDEREVIGCRSIFEYPIERTNAEVVGELLAPVPTLILHSKVTHQNVLISATLTCPVVRTVDSQELALEQQVSMEVHQKNFPLQEWNWMSLKRELEAKGQDHDTSSQTILELISTIHLIVALYFCDLYYLNLNPSANPKLFSFLAEPTFPDSLRQWVEPLQNSLVDAQHQIKEEIDRIHASEAASLVDANEQSYTSFDDFSGAPVVILGFVILFLFVTCSQQSSNTTGSYPSNPNSVVIGQPSQGILARIEIPAATGYNAINLRSEPRPGDEFVVGQVINGEQVTAYEISPDGQWRRILLSNGRVGWVASNMVK